MHIQRVLCEACAWHSCKLPSGPIVICYLGNMPILLKTAAGGSTFTEPMRLYNVSFKLHVWYFFLFIFILHPQIWIRSVNLSEQQHHAHKAHTTQWQESPQQMDTIF